MRNLSRRQFLDLTAAVASLAAAGCINTNPPQDDPTSSAGGAGGGDGGGADGTGGAGGAGGDGGAGGAPQGGPTGAFPVAVTGYQQAAQRSQAIMAAVELAGGMPWLKPGDSVLIKVAQNSPNAYPATASPAAAAALVELCLAAGAGKIWIADLMGLENTLMPGGWSLESPFGGGFDPDTDGTVRAFRASGLWDAVVAAAGADNVGPGRKVELTSFREHGFHRYESTSDTVGTTPQLCADWVKHQVEIGERWDGQSFPKIYVPRTFDALVADVPGMYVPNLIADVDHIINLHRISTHVMSHHTLALKNWVGIMRPDDRIWMHQIGYLKNHRGVGDHPIRTEPAYNELLAELHLCTRGRERLMLADATSVIASGGPDESDKALYPAQLVVAAGDLVSADVVGLSIIRLAVLVSKLAGGLGGECSPPPQSAGSLALGFVSAGLSIPWHDHVMYGNDAKFCDAGFSHWDWVTVQRARELGLGALSPADVDLRFGAGDFAVPEEQRSFIEADALLPPNLS